MSRGGWPWEWSPEWLVVHASINVIALIRHLVKLVLGAAGAAAHEEPLWRVSTRAHVV